MGNGRHYDMILKMRLYNQPNVCKLKNNLILKLMLNKCNLQLLSINSLVGTRISTYIYSCLVYICTRYIYIYIYNSEKIQLEFESRIQFCVMCLNLCGDHTIIIYLNLCHVST